MKFVQRMMMIAQLTVGENVRLPNRYNVETLKADIKEHTLLNPITVWKPEASKDIYEVLQGHRRLMAIQQIAEESKEAFNAVFPKGIPCLVAEGVSADEALILKVDQGNQETLTHPHEVQRAANMLFLAGSSEKEVAISLAGLLDKIAPMRASNRKEYDALKAKIGKEPNAQKDADEFLFSYRRGLVQTLHNTFRCPDIVMQALYFHACGSRPDGVAEDVYLPDLTTKQVAALWKAHMEDLQVKEGGRPKYSKRIVGPKFTAKWTEIIDAEKQKATEKADKVPRTRPMSASDMRKQVEDGTLMSILSSRLTDRHCGEKAEDVAKYDNIAYMAELVQSNRPELWKQVVAAVQEIEAEITKAREAEEAESKKVA